LGERRGRGPGTDQVLVGRKAEYDRLAAALQQARQGTGRICILKGPAGIGKTRLVKEALSTPVETGFDALYGAATELEQRRPFGVVTDCLEVRPASPDQRRASIADLLVGAAPAGTGIPAEAATTEFRVVEAILALVEELCAKGPVAMGVDDLQWADPSSLLVLSRLARHLDQLPLLLICSWRALPR
jgi:predicted ATPase